MDVCLLEQEPEVASCGYRALADFPEAVHTINLLPEAVSHDLLSLYIPHCTLNVFSTDYLSYKRCFSFQELDENHVEMYVMREPVALCQQYYS